jgi:predicted RNA-binding Zn ribbon-like protein
MLKNPSYQSNVYGWFGFREATIMQQPVPSHLARLGGRTCLDFVNTVSSRVQPDFSEYLPDYCALAAWARQVDLIGKQRAFDLQRMAANAPQAARRAHRAAVELREALYRIFSAIIDGETPRHSDMAALNERLVRARPLQSFVASAGGFVWRWNKESYDLEAPALLVAIAAADFLTGDDLSRLKRCPPPEGCGWLFYDESRNRSRRWCSMETCGSWAKSKSFRERWISSPDS